MVQSYMLSIREPRGVPSRSSSLVPGGGAHRTGEDESADAKEVDMLLREIGVILGRW